MSISNWNHGMLACVALLAVAGPAVGNEVTADQRAAARIYARIENPLASRDQKAYCEAFHGTEDYRGYVGRACEFGVKMGVRKPEQCTAQAVAAEAEADRKKCLAMDRASFDATVAKQGEIRANFVKSMAERGIDGDKLIAEERGKLK